MSKPKSSANFILVVFSILALDSAASAQSNLTAKPNTVQPPTVSAAVESDRVRDGLAGPVRRVRTEVAKLMNKSGSALEEKRVVLETASYDIKGGKTENQYFPVAGSNLTGKEVYQYDERGNISEMTLLHNDGSLLGKEVYKYEYDSMGNWIRMTTSVAVVEGGKVTFEPSEVTYRSIMYYLDENMLKMAQPAAATAGNTIKVDSKPQPVPTSETTARPVNGPVSNQVVAVNKKAVVSLPAVNTAMNRSSLNASVLAGANSAPVSTPGTRVVLDSEPPDIPTPQPLLKPVSGGVLNGKALSLPAPVYPDAARRLRTSGIVTVEVVLDETGKVISAQAISGPAILRDVAIQAAIKARFSATKLSGQPVKVSGVINYRFSLAP